MDSLLVWLYLANSAFLLLHQIDAVYWKEWYLFFGKKEGITGFIWFNLAAILIVLYGFVQAVESNFQGIIFSFILAITGIFTFLIHSYYFAKGRKEFKTPLSIFILVAVLIISLIQLIAAILLA